MSDITTANVVYVSSSKNGDYVQATPHDGAARYIRADAPKLVALVEAVGREIEARNLYLATAPDRGAMSGPKGQRLSALHDAQAATGVALAQWEALQ